MTDKKILNEYKKIIENTKTSNEFKKSFNDFIDKYDGEESAELHNFLILLSKELLDIELLKIKAESYDKISREEEELAKKMANLLVEAHEEGIFEPPIPT